MRSKHLLWGVKESNASVQTGNKCPVLAMTQQTPFLSPLEAYFAVCF